MTRANYIGAPEFFELNQACRTITEAYGCCVYLVGSALERRDFRDVDVRCILDDAVFDREFPGHADGQGAYYLDAKWSLQCSAISLWLARHSGLKIDFQFQRQTQANAEYPKGGRCAIGIFLDPPKP